MIALAAGSLIAMSFSQTGPRWVGLGAIAWVPGLTAKIIAMAGVSRVTFAATDGRAAYLEERKVDWYPPGVMGRYLGFALLLVVVELAVAGGYLVLGRLR